MKFIGLGFIVLLFVPQVFAATKIDPDDVQILFVETQNSFISQSLTEKPTRIRESLPALAQSARVLKIPMTFCIVPVDGKFEPLIPDLATFATSKTTFSRGVTAPFLEPKIAEAIRSNKRKILVVAGFAAEVAVLQSTLDGVDSGFQIQVPVDAVGSISERTEQAALGQMAKAGANITSVLSLVMRMAPEIDKSPGLQTFAALKPILKPSK